MASIRYSICSLFGMCSLGKYATIGRESLIASRFLNVFVLEISPFVVIVSIVVMS